MGAKADERPFSHMLERPESSMEDGANERS
jgi:hypothetical protein